MTPPALSGRALERPAIEALPRPASRHFRLGPRPAWRLTQFGVDVLTVFGAAAATYTVYLVLGLGRRHFDPLLYGQIGLAFSALTVFALHGYGEYSDALGLLRIESIRRVILAVTSGLLLTLALTFLVRLTGFSRLTLLMAGPATIALVTLQRFATWTIEDLRAAARRRPVLVFGAGETGRVLAQHMLEEHPLGMQPVGFHDDDAALRGVEIRVGAGPGGARVSVLGGEDDLEAALERTGAEAVFVALPSADPARVARLVAVLESRGLAFYCVPGAGNLVFSTLSFGQIAGMPVFTRRAPSANRPYEMLKRIVDLVGASMLLALTAPLLAAGAIAVKLSSPGRVLFAQERVGLRGRCFTIWKLRTMRSDAPKYAYHPSSAKDARVTRLGHWLRRTSIDELPQLFNVLRGEMSLVGPRPEMPFIVAGYNDMQKLRLTVKPGLTGLWQISADRAFHIHDNIHYDLYYVERRSMLLDLAILLVTPLVLLAKNRAM